MAETDLIIMSLVIFLPTVFALGLLFFPKGSEEWMRWWALTGTAVTLVFSIIMFISFYAMLESHSETGHPLQGPASQLSARAEEAAHRSFINAPPLANDWVARYAWVPKFNIFYYVGADGISMPLILLTTVISFLAMIASWKIDRYVRGYCMLFLILETGMLGTFLALDFFLFYIFWEVMLLPMYFLIGVWGGPRREYAAIKFFLYTLLGSVFILIALLGLYFTDIHDFVGQRSVAALATQIRNTDSSVTPKAAEQKAEGILSEQYKNSFDLVMLQRVGEAAARKLNGESPENIVLNENERKELKANNAEVRARLESRKKSLDQPFFTPIRQLILFLLLFIGFAIKVPLFPFHTWLPDAHVEAPTPISMILAGVLLKLGGYGIIRIAYPICPWAAEYLAWWISLFGIINIVYGAFAAMAQTDFKKLVAYSSVSHMGYVILGIAVWSSTGRQYWSWGMNGAMFQMIAHGITSAGMFFLVGVIYDRAHHRNLDNFRGLYEPMPLYGGLSAVMFFAAMGLPGMCGFVGEFMVVLATWNFDKLFSVLSALTVVVTAAYILWTLQRVFQGQNPAYKDYLDINFRELLCIVPLVILAVALGVFPNLLLSWMEPSVTNLVDTLAQVGGLR